MDSYRNAGSNLSAYGNFGRDGAVGEEAVKAAGIVQGAVRGVQAGLTWLPEYVPTATRGWGSLRATTGRSGRTTSTSRTSGRKSMASAVCGCAAWNEAW